VDTYRRHCRSARNPDGSLRVTAPGTALNPDYGFEFTLHGHKGDWVAEGTLNAFGQCRGPFVARVLTYLDNGVTTYELRFHEHCMIVIR
jgi:hypothetical protein